MQFVVRGWSVMVICCCGLKPMHILTRLQTQMFADLCPSYLGVHDHQLMPEVMRHISELGVNISPAEAAGILDADRKDPDRALARAIEHS